MGALHTEHQFYFSPAQHMAEVPDASIDLVVTSPPYPMIAMWDTSFAGQDPVIAEALEAEQGMQAFTRMHAQLDAVWQEVQRVVRPGGMVCINIGDATRTLNGTFQLYPNHARILNRFLELGFHNLPNILWRKPTNAPNKFMGSGMLAPGAYVTLEHEHILIFRKGGKRTFTSDAEKQRRARSAFFWEERNQWFSDLWEFRGTTQQLEPSASRTRSGAFPFELAYRLIQMFSLQEDTVLDPFLGTGTTTLAALASGRNSIGYEREASLLEAIRQCLHPDVVSGLQNHTEQRLQQHRNFVQQRQAAKGAAACKYKNAHYGFPVMTRQEQGIELPVPQSLSWSKEGQVQVQYEDH